MAILKFLQSIFSEFMTKIVVSLVIVLIGFIIGRMLGKLVQGVLHELEFNKALEKAGVKISIEEMIGHFTSYFIYFIAVIMALNQIGVTTIVLNILAGGAIALIILSLALAFKDYIPNMISGIFIHQKRFIEVGDMIKVNGIQGKITNINLVETHIQTKEKDMIYVPNSMLTKKKIIKIRKKKS